MKEPKFVPKPGQTDYTKIRYAPVVNVIAVKDDKILLVKRSGHLRIYPGAWSTIDGFLDDSQSIEGKALEELWEEAGIKKEDVADLTRGKPYIVEAPQYNKTWLVVPVMAVLKTDKIRISDEASAAGWFTHDELPGLDLLPNKMDAFKQFLDI